MGGGVGGRALPRSLGEEPWKTCGSTCHTPLWAWGYKKLIPGRVTLEATWGLARRCLHFVTWIPGNWPWGRRGEQKAT